MYFPEPKYLKTRVFFRDWSDIDGQEANMGRIFYELPSIFKCTLIIDLKSMYV
jgi:hypothetical protein